MLYFESVIEFYKWFRDNPIIGTLTVLGVIMAITILLRLLPGTSDDGKKTTGKAINTKNLKESNHGK